MTTKLLIKGDKYTREQMYMMNEIHDRMFQVARDITKLNDAIGDDGDWLYAVFGQTSGSIQDALCEAASALEARTTGALIVEVEA